MVTSADETIYNYNISVQNKCKLFSRITLPFIIAAIPHMVNYINYALDFKFITFYGIIHSDLIFLHRALVVLHLPYNAISCLCIPQDLHLEMTWDQKIHS